MSSGYSVGQDNFILVSNTVQNWLKLAAKIVPYNNVSP